MAAEVLAAELGLDLYQIDLGALMSKYIGETEKNLRRGNRFEAAPLRAGKTTAEPVAYRRLGSPIETRTRTMNKRLLSGAVFTLTLLMIAAGPAPMTWNVDVPHTGINFSVKHFFTPVQGEFDDYKIELIYDRENPENSSVRVSIDVTSVNTGNDRRDNHLMSAHFFEAETYPYITFVSESVRQVAADRLIVRGPLKIKGQVRDVELPVTLLGVKDIPVEMQEMLGGVTQVASFETELRVVRGDYNVGVGSWAANIIVGDNVDISIAVEANRK